jgi:steroid 5-alpha reductase family enzyme
MGEKEDKRTNAVRIYFITYLIAILISAASLKYYFVSGPHLERLFYADLLGASVIFAFCIFFDNISIYDPYWTIQVSCISFYYLFNWTEQRAAGTLKQYEIRNVVVLLLTNLWSVRLTSNLFLNSVEDIKHEDWRYSDYRKKTSSRVLYFLVSSIFLLMDKLISTFNFESKLGKI